MTDDTGPENAAPRWAYLTLHTVHHSGVVVVHPDHVGRELPDHIPGYNIRDALSILGNEGWRLVGIDPSAPSGSIYVLIRPDRRARVRTASDEGHR